MLTELTDAQRSAMGPWAQQWIDRALDCAPADERAVENAIRECYEYAGIEWHGNVVWVDSPVVGVFAAPIAADVIGQTRRRDAVGGAVRVAVGGAVDGAVRVAVRGAVDGAVRVAVGGAVGDAVRGAVDGAVRVAVGGAVRGAWWRRIGGQYWAWWNAYTSFFRDVIELDLPGDTWDRSRAYETANSAGYWWPYRDVTIVSRRHTSIHRDTQGRLHNTSGPAIAWGGGWAIHALDGIRVPEWVVTDPTPARILSDELPNTEQRRVAMAHYGWGRAVDELGLEVIDRADDPTWGTLYRLPDSVLDEPGQATLLVAENASPDRDGTTRVYGLLASGDARTVVGAQASLAQLSEDEWLALDGAS